MKVSRRSLDQQHSIVETGHSYGIILDSREIFLNGEVDTEGVLSNKFLTNIRILTSKSKTEPIIIHQHSLGGDWSCGMMIYDSIRYCPCPIIFICHGIAASVGSVIPMACISHGNSYIINMPNCDWLIHDGTSGVGSGLTIRQAKSWVDWEENNLKIMREMYVEACCRGEAFKGKNKSQIRSKIKSKMNSDEDWWLSARDAVYYGFADAVIGDHGFESIDSIKEYF